MIVDDLPENLRLLENILKTRGYNVQAMPDGTKALECIAGGHPDLILLDISMPGLNGYQVCKILKEDNHTAGIPVIFLSALNEMEDKIKAFQVGGVDYITKPFHFDEVMARVSTHLRIKILQNQLEDHNRHLQERVEAQVREISESQMATIFALAKLAEYRDMDTGMHLERVQGFCGIIALWLKKSTPLGKTLNSKFVRNMYEASPLHDIGKVAIPDSILLKPGKLTIEEWEVMKTHTTIGAENLKAVLHHYPENSFIQMGIEIAQYHHERWDGHGYPIGLAGEDIPLSARIMAVVDVYDAVRSKRCYKDPISHIAARKIITDGSGSHFDPQIVEAFLAEEEIILGINDEPAL
jgi:putative two-component system response regulator